MSSVIEQYANVVVKFETKGMSKVNNDFNKMMNVNKKGIVDLREAQIRAQKKVSKGYKGKGVALPGSSPIQKVNTKEMIGLEKNFGTLKQKLHSRNIKREEEQQKTTTLANQKTTRNQNAVNKLMSGGANDLLKNADRVGELEKRHNSFGRALLMNNENLNKFVKGGGEFSKRSARWGHKLRMMSTGLRGFKMELLGIMFFGMAMQRLFTGLLKPALELTGVFELWKTTLQVLFLPISLLIMEFLMPLMMWLMNLSPATKLLIGKLVLLGAALGVILFVGGTLLLGLGALIGFFSGMFNVIDKLIPEVSIAGVEMGSFMAAGLGISVVTTLFGGFKNVISKVLDKLLGFKVIEDLFDKLGIKIDDNLTAWQNFKVLFGGVIDKIKEKLGIGSKSGDTEKSFIEKTFDDITTKFTEMKNTIKDELDAMGITGEGGLIEQFSDFSQTITDMMPTIESLADSLETVATVIGKVADAWERLNTAAKNQRKMFTGIGEIGATGLNPSISVGSGITQENDFLVRPGQKTVSINPNDTLIGVKDTSKLGGSGATINQTLNITAYDKDDIIRLIAQENDKLMNNLARSMG